jgi:hypothetical protein
LQDDTTNFKLRNNGLEKMEVQVYFVEGYFRLLSESSSFSIQPDSTLELELKYNTPDFDSVNVDTLKISHNGFGEELYSIPVKGRFDSLYANNLINSNLELNGNQAAVEDITLPEQTAARFTIPKGLLKEKDNIRFRVKYHTGGPGNPQIGIGDLYTNSAIPFNKVSDKGIVYTIELITDDGDEPDSIKLFDYANIQTALNKFSPKKIDVPISIPAEQTGNAEVNWRFFGFPFVDVRTDSLFSDFGGIQNMKDGEWIVYEYDGEEEEFAPIQSEYLEPQKGYFIAQSLEENFELSYQYEEVVTTRKLTDTVMALDEEGWKTVSNPFTFPVQTDESVWKYRNDKKSFITTNILNPGEAYFVEPEIDSLVLKTYGTYYPSIFPKVFAEAGWSLDLNISSESKNDLLKFSVLRNGQLSKSDNKLKKLDYEAPPDLNDGFETYIQKNNKRLKYSIGENSKIWEVRIRDNSNSSIVEVKPEIDGEIPKHLNYLIYDNSAERIINDSLSISLQQGETYRLTVVLGSKEFLEKFKSEINASTPVSYKLYQNYPNPFNPVTKIKYDLAKDSKVKLIIYDILGRKVKVLEEKFKDAGTHLINFKASNLPSSVYFYELNVENEERKFRNVKKMLLLK